MPVQTRLAKKRAAEQDGAEPSEATQSVQMLECQTCYEDGPGLAFGHAVHADVSGHEHFNCYNCWERYIKDRLDDENSAEISCLHCPRKLEEQDMRILNKHFATDLYARWLDHVALALAKADPKWKSCPSQTCPGGCIVDDGYIFTCPTCNLRCCTSCNIPMHEGESCSQYRNRDARIIADEQASLAKVAEISKPCPKCSSKLSKAGGCDHMTCAICRHDFCWGCLVAYQGAEGILTAGNHKHGPYCPHYRPHPHYQPRPTAQNVTAGLTQTVDMRELPERPRTPY